MAFFVWPLEFACFWGLLLGRGSYGHWSLLVFGDYCWGEEVRGRERIERIKADRVACSANNTICLYVPLFAYYEVPSLLLGQAKRCVDFKPKIFWLQQGLEH